MVRLLVAQMANSLMPIPLPVSPPHLDTTLGAILIGEIFTAILFGITTVQIYLYFCNCPRDGYVIRRTIIVLWVLDVIELVLTSHTVYYYAVKNFMNPLALVSCPWSLGMHTIAEAVSDSLVTVIFVYRIWKLSGKLWPLLFIAAATTGGGIGGIAIGILAFKYPLYSDFQERFSWIWYSCFILQAFADCAIATSLCRFLIKKRTGFKRTDSLIRILILYSISTCMLTSSVAISSVMTYALMPHNFIFIAIAIVLPKLMFNALLALLNSRDTIRDKHCGQAVSLHFSHLTPALSNTCHNAPAVASTREPVKDSMTTTCPASSGAHMFQNSSVSPEANCTLGGLTPYAMFNLAASASRPGGLDV